MIRTDRLLLRHWKENDLPAYAEINADPIVREFFPTRLTRAESDAEARRIEQRHNQEGFCLFAAELVEEARFIGFIGMQTMRFAVPSLPQPAVEIGWRLGSPDWGRGLATEGARAVLQFAFGPLGLARIVAITVPQNARSRRVMEKLGMRHHPELDFDHPLIAEGHPLRQHILYAITRDEARLASFPSGTT